MDTFFNQKILVRENTDEVNSEIEKTLYFL